jgi:hypothetical protein
MVLCLEWDAHRISKVNWDMVSNHRSSSLISYQCFGDPRSLYNILRSLQNVFGLEKGHPWGDGLLLLRPPVTMICKTCFCNLLVVQILSCSIASDMRR